MTESEWVGCEDPTLMLDFLNGTASERKLRLFACACCRRIWHELLNCLMTHTTPEQGWRAVATAERYADGGATAEELACCLVEPPCIYAAPAAFFGAAGVTLDLGDVIRSAADAVAADDLIKASLAERAQAGILHEIIGNPFRPVTVNPVWLTPTVRNLARSAYEERIMPSGELDSDRLAVLSDALEEAGCDVADILNHLRSPGPHVRGCWVVDLLLGRS